jgi:hypothetical protein
MFIGIGCAYVFIKVSDRMCISICVCSAFIKKLIKLNGNRSKPDDFLKAEPVGSADFHGFQHF